MRTRDWLPFLALLAACGGGGDGEPDAGLGGPRDPFPTLYCPGSPGCTGAGGDGVLRVGSGRMSITPDIAAHETEWTDTDMNNQWDSGEDFVDTNSNGVFDAVWMAGFGNGRPAIDVHSGVWVSAIVFEWNDIRVGIAVVDAVGWMANEIDTTREMLPASLELDHLIISSTHVHESQDTMGLWGRKELETGLDLDYQQFIREQTVAAVSLAVERLQPVHMQIAQVEARDEDGSTLQYVGDNRDPNILDPTVTVVQFTLLDEPETTWATLVHWAAHPEYSGSRNNLITADYVDQLREVIVNGIGENTTRGLPALTGLGGDIVFLQGPLGGQIGPNGTMPIDEEGVAHSDDTLDVADSVGRNVARLALTAITGEDVVDVDSPDIDMRTGELDLAVENTYYHVASIVGVFDREFYGHNANRPVGPENIPFIASRVSWLRVGPIGIITAPGELHPELFIGGYDGSATDGRDIVDPNNENPPNLANAPPGPYLRDLVLENPGVEFPLVLGLGEDMVGYIVPSWNYELDPNGPYISEAPGDHYEETNSVGPRVEEQAVGAMRALLEWRPPSDSP
jgi:hypothetical protein